MNIHVYIRTRTYTYIQCLSVYVYHTHARARTRTRTHTHAHAQPARAPTFPKVDASSQLSWWQVTEFLSIWDGKHPAAKVCKVITKLIAVRKMTYTAQRWMRGDIVFPKRFAYRIPVPADAPSSMPMREGKGLAAGLVVHGWHTESYPWLEIC